MTNKTFYQKYKNSIKEWQLKNKDSLREKRKINYIGNVKYNGANKNRIRDRIVEEVQRENIKTILTLESPSFLFSKLLPNRKIIIFEHDNNIYKLMIKNKPSNVKVFFGDISQFADLNSDVDMVYLDFCQSYLSCKETISQLKNTIDKAKLIAFTFCVRGGERNLQREGDYQLYLVKELQELTNINLRVIYGEGYSDSGAIMFTCLFRNPEWGRA
jgi:hypothetical protein